MKLTAIFRDKDGNLKIGRSSRYNGETYMSFLRSKYNVEIIAVIAGHPDIWMPSEVIKKFTGGEDMKTTNGENTV